MNFTTSIQKTSCQTQNACMVYKHAYLNTLLLLHSTFMLRVWKMLLKGEVGGHALNSHGNCIVDHRKSWKNHELCFLISVGTLCIACHCLFLFQAPYNTLVFNVVNNFNSVAAEYLDVSVNAGEVYVRRSLTLITNNQLVVSCTKLFLFQSCTFSFMPRSRFFFCKVGYRSN